MGDFRQQQEVEERMMFELGLIQRIERGLATKADAQYVARLFGLTTEKTHEQERINI
jgi:hypothetical protein